MLSSSRKSTGSPTSFMVGVVKTMISTIGSSGQIWPSIVIRLTWLDFSCSNIIRPTPTKISVKWWKKAWKTNWTTMASVPSIIRCDFWPRFYIVVLGMIFFFIFSICPIQFLFGLLFSFFYHTFISLYYLDFYFPFLFGLLFPFSIWTFCYLF